MYEPINGYIWLKELEEAVEEDASGELPGSSFKFQPVESKKGPRKFGKDKRFGAYYADFKGNRCKLIVEECMVEEDPLFPTGKAVKEQYVVGVEKIEQGEE